MFIMKVELNGRMFKCNYCRLNWKTLVETLVLQFLYIGENLDIEVVLSE